MVPEEQFLRRDAALDIQGAKTLIETWGVVVQVRRLFAMIAHRLVCLQPDVGKRIDGVNRIDKIGKKH
jgi:hypothetical protein